MADKIRTNKLISQTKKSHLVGFFAAEAGAATGKRNFLSIAAEFAAIFSVF